jgi:hypothetical protein
MAVRPLDLWNDWSSQILVLLSLGLQLVLFLFAGIRRREAPMVPKFILWLAYQLADSTAIYAMGHLSLSAAADGHHLVAFWAPFLLLHLGGPDNITAYAFQDNELWLRHLLTLVVQVLGAAYLLSKHIVDNGFLILLATILMSAVGIVKYGERIWALRCGNMDSIRSSLKKQPPAKHNHFHPHDHGLDKEERQLRRAHSLFHICTRAIVDSSVEADSDDHETSKIYKHRVRYMWLLMEMELSLMYDLLYTKAAVAHTWFGYCVRFISPVAAASSLLLFHFSGKDRRSGVDVVVTYILLAGAFFMEATSLLNTLASTWTFAFLYATRWNCLKYRLLCSGRWDRLRRAVLSLRWRLWRRMARRSSLPTRRRWSGTMGQYNMLHYCSQPAGPLLSRLANMLGFKELWDRKHYTGKIQISHTIRKAVTDSIERLYRMRRINVLGVLRKKWSKEALEKWNLYGDLYSYIGIEFQEGIIIWHITTDIFLVQSKVKKGHELVKAVRAMSNYMMFLLVERPYMLPGLSQTRLYQQTCRNLFEIRDEDTNKAVHHKEDFLSIFNNLFRMYDDPTNPSYSRLKRTEELASILHDKNPRISSDVPRLSYAISIANTLLAKELSWSLQVLLDVWTDMLVYAANRCSRESHAKKLNDGGELLTILWLMIEHLHHFSLDAQGKT